LLGELAIATNMAVTCTIHQPSASVYDNMGKLLLLTKARTAYYGPASELMGYVASLGNPVPAGVSVSEHALDLVNADFASEESVEEMIEAWRKRAPPPLTAEIRPLPAARERASGVRLCLTLIEKIFKNEFYDPAFAFASLGVIVLSYALFGMVTFDARHREQTDVIVLFYACYLIWCMPVFQMMIIILAMVERWPTFRREITSAMYGPIAFWSARTIVFIVTSLLTTFCIVLPAWIINDINPSAIPSMLIVVWVQAFFFAAFANLLGLCKREAATALAGMITLHMIMTSGQFFDVDEIIWPFRVFTYILPARLGFAALVRVIIGQSHDFSGAIRLSDAPPDVLRTPAAKAAIRNNMSFVCPDSPDVCYADTGDAVLRRLHILYAVADANLEWTENAGWILLQAICVLFLGGVAVYLATRPPKGRQVAQHSSTENSALLAKGGA